MASLMHHVLIERPNRIHHVIIVRVDDMRAHIAMAGQVNLRHFIQRQGIDIDLWIEPVIIASDIHIVRIQQQMTAGLFCHLGDEYTFRNVGCFEFEIGRGVFKRDGAT